MLGSKPLLLVILGITVLGGQAPGALAGALTSRVETDIHGLYERLQPGMTVEEVAAAVDSWQLRTAPRPVSSWVVWSSVGREARATAVLRVAFREERLVRAEYEVFGDQYRRLVKGGGEPEIEVYRAQLRRLADQSERKEQAVDVCQTALEAYHRLTLGAQERLTREEQAAWARALQLRRAVERSMGGSGSLR